MINIFTPAVNDQSIYYLAQIFGVMGTLFPAESYPSFLLGTMFKFINTMALTLGAFLVVYSTIVGLLNTAAEGEFMGKKGNIWIPIRTVMGIALLFPTGSGYSAIQIVMMWVILQGVGAADTLWGITLNYINVTGSPYASINMSSGSLNVGQSMQSLFQSATCHAGTLATTYPETYTRPGDNKRQSYYYCSDPAHQSENFCTDQSTAWSVSTASGTFPSSMNAHFDMGPGGKCGKLNYCNVDLACVRTQNPTLADKIKCDACKTQQAVLADIVATTIAPAAKALVSVDHDYITFSQTVFETPRPNTFPVTKPCGTTGSGEACVPPAIFAYCVQKGTYPCCIKWQDTSNPQMTVGSEYCRQAAGFPDLNSGTNQSNYANASTDAVNKIYYPYLSPILQDNFLGTLTGQYTNAIEKVVAQDIADEAAKNPMGKTGTGYINDAKKMGWILAGSYYYKIAQLNNQNMSAAMPIFTVESDPGDPGSSFSWYRTNASAAGVLIQQMLNQQSAVTQSSTTNVAMPSQLSSVSREVSATTGSLVDSFTKTMTNNRCNGASCPNGFSGGANNTNPVISVATFGYQLMIIAQTILAIVVGGFFILGVLTSINFIAFGTGLTLNPVGEGIKTAAMILTPFIFLLVGSLFTLGALLGIYVPLIPYIIFIMGAVGWFIACIEAMVAGPIVALAILAPGGQHEILGHATQGFYLLLNLFLRPMLMVFGMMASMLLAAPVVNLINAGFVSFIFDIFHPGLFESIIIISAYATLIVTALNKVFSLIYHVPERVLTWIGGPAVQYGEEAALQGIKGAVEGAAGAISKAGQESAGVAAKEFMKKAKKQADISAKGKKGG